MSTHDYTPEEALSILMKIIKEHSSDLSEQIQDEIDSGKNIFEYTNQRDMDMGITARIDSEYTYRSRRKSLRKYWKIISLDHNEALQVLLDILHTYFIEQCLFTNSIIQCFSSVDIDISDISHDSSEDSSHKKYERIIEIELRSETQIEPGTSKPFQLNKIPEEDIKQQKQNLTRLRQLTDFSGE